MTTKTKIKILDNTALRLEIDCLYEKVDQINLAKWAIKCVRHILLCSEIENFDKSLIEIGFSINELWQIGKASVYELRQASFKIHEIARQCKSESSKNAIRAAGHAVSVGHMKEHAMVCSDYAIKTIQLIFPQDIAKISDERQWQLNELTKFTN